MLKTGTGGIHNKKKATRLNNNRSTQNWKQIIKHEKMYS